MGLKIAQAAACVDKLARPLGRRGAVSLLVAKDRPWTCFEKWRVPLRCKANPMTKQKRFAKEFEEEAVRLVGTSGRTKRQIAVENEILRQERDVSKRATAFCVREGSL